jgi:hypothetical protein
VKHTWKKSTHPDDEESNGDQQTLAEAIWWTQTRITAGHQ